jgi:hypothetical protein
MFPVSAYPLRGAGRVTSTALSGIVHGNDFASVGFRFASARDGLQELDTCTAGKVTRHGRKHRSRAGGASTKASELSIALRGMTGRTTHTGIGLGNGLTRLLFAG